MITELKVGNEVSLPGGYNRYEVVELNYDSSLDRTFAKLKCVWWVKREDLGDEIFIDDGHSAWIASYHWRRMEVTSDKPVHPAE